MKTALKEFLELLDYLDSFVRKLCILLTGAMTLTVVMQVFFRYVVHQPLTWTEELSRYLLIWSAFLGGSSLVRNHENMHVDFFILKLPDRFLHLIKIMLGINTILFLTVLLYLAIRVYPKVALRQITPALQINMFYVQVSVIIGIALMVLQAINVFLSELLNRDSENV